VARRNQCAISASIFLQLLGSLADDRDEIGFAQAPLRCAVVTVAARAAMQHRGLRCRERKLAAARRASITARQ